MILEKTKHFYSLLTTNSLIFLFTLIFTFSAFDNNTDAEGAKSEVPGNTLAEKLIWLKDNAKSNSNYTITLKDNYSLSGTDGKPNNVNTLDYQGKSNITITLIGESTECTISLKGNGSLFDVRTGVTLVLDNKITLKGDNSNSSSLVDVSGGTLIMKTDSKITGNTAYSGGGVSVFNSGTFTMNDSASISGNTASSSESYGGGVYVKGGTFTMNDSAAIFGNTASSSESYGGGVYVEGGTFTMNGSAAISGNTVSSSKSYYGSDAKSYGGGVYVEGGTFTMNDSAVISGNTDSSSESYDGGYKSYGGGVYVFKGTFSMNGNVSISGNTAYHGGGVVSSGTFSMNDSASISGNSYGSGVISSGTFSMNDSASISGNSYRGVYVSDGTFSMNDSASISGNSNGGVYVSGKGIFTMNDSAAISGNTASGSGYKSYGGGVYVSDGTFSMHGNVSISGNTASIGGGVYVEGGTFNISGGIVYGSNEGILSNASTGDSNASAALYLEKGTAKYGTEGNWNYIVTLGNNRETTIKVVNETAETTKAPKVKLGEFIGTVAGFDGTEVIVNGKDTIGVQAPMGRALIVDANGEYIYLESTFPMQTVVKCKVTSGKRSQIKKGMKVYLKP